MAKAKKRKKKIARASDVDVMSAFTTAAEKKLGTGVMYSGGDHTQHHVGVPLPSLSWEYLLGSNILYLGAGYGLAGPSQSFKSALGLEIGRIIASYGGLNFLCETEGGKISGAIIKSIYSELHERLKMRLVTSVEAAQDFLSFTFEWIQNQFPDRDRMFGLFLDSLNGPSADERHKAIKKEGHAKRDFPIEAFLWTKWLQDWLPKLTGWPVVLVFVNHKKLSLENPNSFRHPGGDAQDFYSTVYMHVRRVRTNESATRDGLVINQLQLQTVKHSFMLPGRRISTAFVVDKATKNMYFDWGHSTADMLTDEKVKPKVVDIVDVTSTSNSMTALSRRFSCKQVGLTDVTGTEMGAAIHASSELMTALREALYVNMHAVWDGVMPATTPEHNGHEPADLSENGSDEGEDSLELD